MTARDVTAVERALAMGIPVADVLEAWADRLEVLQAAAKAGRGSTMLVLEVPISRGKQLRPVFLDRVEVGRRNRS